MIEFCSPVCGGLSIYAVYPQCLKEELDCVQSRSLRVIVLPHNYLTTLTEGTNEATSRYLDTITGNPSHISYQQFMSHNNPDYNLRHRNEVYAHAAFWNRTTQKQFYSPSDE